MLGFLSDLLYWFNNMVLVYFFSINTIYLLLITVSFVYIRGQLKTKNVFDLSGIFQSDLYKPVSILSPAFNEEASIVASVRSLLNLEFPEFQVVVINDGSTDRTLEVMIEEFELKPGNRYVPPVIDHKPIRAVYESERYPELLVIDKENGRKADALNAGINAASYDLVCAIDSDSVLESNVLQQMLRVFIEDDDCIAVGGIVRVANGCTFANGELTDIAISNNFWARIQVVEYLRAFLFGRVGWDYLNSLLIISGAFGVFDRNAVMRVGGYLHDTVGEDMELVVRLHRYYREHNLDYKVRFVAEPVCWTEVPESGKVLARQRNRWQRGFLDSMWRHKKMLFNPRYGHLGFFAVPFFLFFEGLGPIIEVAGYITVIIALLTGAVNIQFAILFLTVAILLGVILSLASVICEEMTFRRYPRIRDVLIMTLYAFIENFGYRQIHAWWRLRGVIDFFRGNQEWGKMTRTGFKNKK